MTDRTKYFFVKLRRELRGLDRSATNITNKIASMFVSGWFVYGEIFSTQREMATELKISMKVVKHIWSLLIDPYNIIVGNRSVGTHIVQYCHPKELLRISQIVPGKISQNSKLLFDRDTAAKGNPSFQASLNKAFLVYPELAPNQRNIQVLPELVTEFIRLLKRFVQHSFKEKQVHYTDNYPEFLYNAFYNLLGPKDKVVIVNPYSKIIELEVTNARRTFQLIGLDKTQLWIAELESACETAQVGIVYLGPALLASNQLVINEDIWERLLNLHTRFGILILMDNRFPDLIELPQVPITLWNRMEKVIIYVSQITLHHPDLFPANLIAAHGSHLTKLKRMNTGSWSLLQPKLAHALVYLLQHRELTKNKVDFVSNTDLMDATALEILISCGLWVEEYLYDHLGWFFYLEPKAGDLPADFFEALRVMNIYIMDPKLFPPISTLITGFWINFSNYHMANKLSQDLKKFNATMKDILFKKHQFSDGSISEDV